MYITITYFNIVYLDSLSTTELDISGQLEALRVSHSQVLTSPSLFQQGLPGGY